MIYSIRNIKNKLGNRLNKKVIKDNLGFGLIDAIVSMSLLVGVVTFAVYFSSLRLSTVYETNLITSINKEIQRDIERLKADFWGMYFEKSLNCKGEYCLDDGEPLPISLCADFTDSIIDLESWNVADNSVNKMIQSWRPSEKRSKVFSGKVVTINRELTMQYPLDDNSLNKSIASISYSVKWGKENIHWLNISLLPEAHSWCGG